VLFESIIISQLSENNTRNRVIDRMERGTFWDDLAAFADEVERESELRKRMKKNKEERQERQAKKESTDGLPKYDKPSGLWVDVETGEVIG
jgi:hypothetical protein